jgi:hypothetical protein
MAAAFEHNRRQTKNTKKSDYMYLKMSLIFFNEQFSLKYWNAIGTGLVLYLQGTWFYAQFIMVFFFF